MRAASFRVVEQEQRALAELAGPHQTGRIDRIDRIDRMLHRCGTYVWRAATATMAPRPAGAPATVERI